MFVSRFSPSSPCPALPPLPRLSRRRFRRRMLGCAAGIHALARVSSVCPARRTYPARYSLRIPTQRIATQNNPFNFAWTHFRVCLSASTLSSSFPSITQLTCVHPSRVCLMCARHSLASSPALRSVLIGRLSARRGYCFTPASDSPSNRPHLLSYPCPPPCIPCSLHNRVPVSLCGFARTLLCPLPTPFRPRHV